MIEKIPSSICQDPGHSEIVIIILIVLLGWSLKLFWSERSKNKEAENNWKGRIEDKLDKALENHENCQKMLPEKYVTKNEFVALLKERNEQWGEFNKKFETLLDRFWTHKHIDNGDVERMK
jgi:hypothetical protein